MASTSSPLLTFINNALYNPTHSPLPYTDPTQKSIIRTHLLETLQNFPSLTLSLDAYTSLSGADVTILFKLSGDLSTPSLTSPDVSVTVWVHQDYPYISPMVFTNTGPSNSTPYLRAWCHPGSTLLGLLNNLLVDQPGSTLRFTPRKTDALERVLSMVQFDLQAAEARHVAEVDALLGIQAELRSRGESCDCMISRLENEVLCLERLSRDMRLQTDVVNNWVRFNVNGAGLEVGEEVVEAADEESRWLMEGLAAERAVEDVMYALDKAVEEGVVGFGVYMRQIRVLARDQFWIRARLVKFKGPAILRYLN